MTRAPDFKGTYPSAGEIIGPLWQRMWNLMERNGWATASELTQQARGNESTVRNLLRQAVKRGLVDQQKRGNPRRIHFGIASVSVADRDRAVRSLARAAAAQEQAAASAEAARAAQEALEADEPAVLRALHSHAGRGLTLREWEHECGRAGIPKHRASRAYNSLMAKKLVVGSDGKPVGRVANHDVDRFFPAPLDTPDQGV